MSTPIYAIQSKQNGVWVVDPPLYRSVEDAQQRVRHIFSDDTIEFEGDPNLALYQVNGWLRIYRYPLIEDTMPS